MSDAIAVVPTLAPAPRSDAARARDAQAPDPTQPSFAALLGAALAPAARPLTRPVAAGTDGTASEGGANAEGVAADGAAATGAGATAAIGGGTVAGAPAAGAIVESGGGPGDALLRAATAAARREGKTSDRASDATTEATTNAAADAARDAATAAAATLDVAPAPADAARAAAAHGVHRGTDALAPELRERLGRVVARMKAEHGHDVRVTETFRSQARQDRLHAQGRSAAGPIVTWTRSSNHTLGRAADVMVNGTYDDPAAYATLQRIAREEGLHTLGMRDPGHLELPKSVGGRVDLAELARLGETPGLESLRIERLHVEGDDALVATPTRLARGAEAASPARVAPVVAVAPVAPVAPVAQVATVAHVAAVAQVATPGARRAAPVTGANGAAGVGSVTGATPREANVRVGGPPAARRAAPYAGAAPGTTSATSATVAAGDARTAHSAPGTEAAAGRTGARRERGARDERTDAAPSFVESAAAAASSRGDGLGVAAPDGAARAEQVGTVDHLARLDRIAALRDSAAQRPLSHLTLTLDDGAGGADRIRVGMRGTSVGATLELSDAARAERMTASLGELQHALEARGLEADGLQVRRAGVATEPGEMTRVASAVLEREALRSGASSSAQSQSQSQSQQQQHQPQSHATTQREREERAARDGSQHEDPSSSRHRSRREHEEHTR